METLPMEFTEIVDPTQFNQIALQTFHFQYEHNSTYRSYCDLLNFNPSDLKNISDIPFLPIGFFKTHAIQSFSGKPQLTFTSSGTTKENFSKHHLSNMTNYSKSFNTAFQQFYGAPENWVILALLPSYLEREGSSLIHMMQSLIEQSNHTESGFYLNDFEKLNETLRSLEKTKTPCLLLGVSFALIDFAERFPQQFKSTIVMETGGMKGRREEITREALHKKLQNGFGVSEIHSEYGMTELLSQAYSKGNGRFQSPPWMRIAAYEINDPFSKTSEGKIGRLNIIDLANQESCAFIATDDLGRVYSDHSFEVLGRLDQSDIRGCNLLVY